MPLWLLCYLKAQVIWNIFEEDKNNLRNVTFRTYKQNYLIALTIVTIVNHVLIEVTIQELPIKAVNPIRSREGL